MHIVIVGAGNVGSALLLQARRAGHEVTLTGRSLDKAQAVAAPQGATVKPMDTAARGADIVILAVPYDQAAAALASLGDIDGQVVIDVTNPLTADYMGLTLGFDTSAAESLAQAAPRARIVKAMNTLFAQVMAEGPQFGAAKAAAFFAGDDAAAKATVKAFIESLGFDPIDAGSLRNARYLEPLAGLNIYLGYGAGRGVQIAPTWLSR